VGIDGIDRKIFLGPTLMVVRAIALLEYLDGRMNDQPFEKSYSELDEDVRVHSRIRC
jgi:hypothetical protein